MRSEHTTNDEELFAQGSLVLGQQSLHKSTARSKMKKYGTTRRQKRLPSTAMGNVSGTFSRYSERIQDNTMDMESSKDSLYSLACQNFDLTSFCEDDFAYEESFIQHDLFAKTYAEIVETKRTKMGGSSNQDGPSISDKEIELFKNITHGMPYELSHFPANINPGRMTKIKKLIDKVKLSTSLCILTYIYDLSNVHMRDHYPCVYGKIDAMEPTKYPFERNEAGKNSSTTSFDNSDGFSVNKDDGCKRLSIDTLEDDIKIFKLNRTTSINQYTRDKPATNFSAYYQKCITDKYLFRFGFKQNLAKYPYTTIKPYYPPTLASNQQFKIELIDLQATYIDEPYFASISFVDVKFKQKISEDFLFNFNDDESTNLLEDLQVKYDESGIKHQIDQTRTAILNTSFSSIDDIYVVLRINTLKRDMKKKAYRALYNGSTKKKSDRKKDIVVRLLQRPLLTNSMGWYAYSLKSCIDDDTTNVKIDNHHESQPLQKDMSKLQLTKVINSIDTPDTPYIFCSDECFEDKQDRFSDDEVIEFLVEYHRNNCFKRMNTLAVDFKFSVTKLLSTNDYNIIPNFKTIDQSYTKSNMKLPFAISLQEFYPMNYMLPIKNYQNIVYLELKMLSVIGQKTFPFKYILCKVELINGDDFKPLKCFYNKLNRMELQQEYYTSLYASSKTIYYKESLKIELPLEFHPRTHFMFTFYGVTFEKNHDEKLQKYIQTWLPLLNENVLNVGRHALPLATGEFGEGYESILPTSLTSLSCADWIDDQKPLFVFKFTSHSSISPCNKCVGDILQCNPTSYFDDTGNCVYFKNMLRNYSDKSQLNVVTFLYPLIQKIMSYFFVNQKDILDAFNQTTCDKFNKSNSVMYSDQNIYRIFLDNVFLTLIILLNSALLQLEPFSDLNARSPFLGIYSNYMFNAKHLIDWNMKDFFCSFEKSDLKNQQNKLYNEKIKNAIENFVKCWVTLKPIIFEKSTKFSWFLFELITKMIYALNETTSVNPNIVTTAAAAAAAANGGGGSKTIKLRDPNNPFSKIAFNPEFYKHLIRLCVRLGRIASLSLASDRNVHDIIGSSLTHFMIQIMQYVHPYIIRIMIKVFFDELLVAEDGHINQMISEYKLNILNILIADERIAEIDVFMLVAQPKSDIFRDENLLIEFLAKSTPILNVFITEVIHSLLKEPDLSKKTFDLVFCYILYFCEGKSPLMDTTSGSKLWKNILTRSMYNPKTKLSTVSKPPPSGIIIYDRSNMHAHIALSLYPVVLFIIEFFGREYKAQHISTKFSDVDSLDFSFLKKFSGFSCDNVKTLVLQNMSTYGNTYMTNLCLVFIWILNNLNIKFLLSCLNEWNALKSCEFGVTLYSCLLVFQVVTNERSDPKNTLGMNDPIIRKSKDNQNFKSTDLRDGSLTKSNALALLKNRRIKKCRTRMWASNTIDSEENIQTEDTQKTIYAKDDIIAECSSFIIHTIDVVLHASIMSTLKNDEIVHKCLMVLIQTLRCREPVAIKLDVMYLLNKIFTLTPSWLFGKDYSVINELIKALIFLFCSTHVEIRNKAIEFCYRVFILNLNLHENINATSGVLHFVISSVNLNDNNDFENIFHSISILKSLSNSEKTKFSQSFIPQFASCMGFSLVILTNRSKINYLEKCGCTISVIQTICDIIEQCHDGFDLRLYWLYTLFQILSLDERFSNAAMCNLHMVVSCFENLKINGEIDQFKNIDWNNFKVLSDNLALDVATVPGDATGYNMTFNKYTSKKLIKLIQEAAHYLKKASSSLLAYQTYSVANELCFGFGFYDEIMSVSTQMNDCLKSVCEGNYGTSTYFRIGFYGEPFDSICNYPEYILHYTRMITLSELCEFLNGTWTKVLNGKKLNILTSPYDVNRKTLPDNECHIQVTTVDPFYEESHIGTTRNELEKRYNISKFLYSVPYVMEEPNKFVQSQSMESSLKTQSSRQTIIYSKYSAPYMSPLIPISTKEHSFLTPIEVSIADLKKRSDDLLTVCAMKVPNLVILEGLLQGCVSTSVNQGPLAIAETFLNLHSSKDNKTTDDINHMKLINIFKMLLTNSRKALESFRYHSDPSRIGLCEYMEANYKQLQSALLKYFS